MVVEHRVRPVQRSPAAGGAREEESSTPLLSSLEQHSPARPLSTEPRGPLLPSASRGGWNPPFDMVSPVTSPHRQAVDDEFREDRQQSAYDDAASPARIKEGPGRSRLGLAKLKAAGERVVTGLRVLHKLGIKETLEHRKKLYSQILEGKPRSVLSDEWVDSFSSVEDWQPPSIWYVIVSVQAAELVLIWLWSGGDHDNLPELDPAVHATMMGLLAFLLGFRTSQAYDRWWAGRQKWGEIVFSSRNLASNAASVFTSFSRLRRLITCLILFAWAVRSHLRGQLLGEDDTDDLVLNGLIERKEVEDLASNGVAYLALIDEMRAEIKAEMRAQIATTGRLDGHWDLVVGHDIRALLQASTGCDGINTTPMPFNYLTFLRIYMVVWVLTYPIFIVASFGWTTLPLCAFIVFILLKLEQMAREMSEPFGFDRHDLPLDELCKKIEKSLHEILLRAEKRGGKLEGGAGGVSGASGAEGGPAGPNAMLNCTSKSEPSVTRSDLIRAASDNHFCPGDPRRYAYAA